MYGLNLDGLQKPNDIRVINSPENRNLFIQTLTDFWAKSFLINLLNSNFVTRLPMPGPPHHGE